MKDYTLKPIEYKGSNFQFQITDFLSFHRSGLDFIISTLAYKKTAGSDNCGKTETNVFPFVDGSIDFPGVVSKLKSEWGRDGFEEKNAINQHKGIIDNLINEYGE